ncbi:hypothetical protein ACFSX9_13425 [Flavobacterium ardleyense]|uniref:Uncharacterized protein n=1 Tax=Flavobacterium ardleyense TaxID=2038737 RepID=A0ABW5ZAR9_9FLAO
MTLVKKRQPVYIQVLIRLSFLIIPIVGLYFLVVFNYDPHARCDGDEHRHTMGPMFGFVVYSGVIAFLWLIAMSLELIWRHFSSNKLKYLFTTLLLIFIILMLIFFV